ncbi:mCG147348 [Mus musculus]|nr:mCG147348 [Mus musculus]
MDLRFCEMMSQPKQKEKRERAEHGRSQSLLSGCRNPVYRYLALPLLP